MKRALVLSGGGSRGSFECGVIDYLIREAGLDFHVFIGNSVGALNAAILGMAHNRTELVEQSRHLKDLWLGIKNNTDIYQKNFSQIFNLFFHHGIYRPVGLSRLLQQELNIDRLLQNKAKYFKIGTVAIETGELFFADSRQPNLADRLISYILASTSVPCYFPPVKIDGKHWYDGSLRDVTPLGAAFSEQPDEIYVILTFPVDDNLKPQLAPQNYTGPFNALLRSLEIIASENSANDLQYALLINEYPHLFPNRRKVPVYIIAPDRKLDGDLLEFSPQTIRTNIKKGYERARNLLSQPKGTLIQSSRKQHHL